MSKEAIKLAIEWIEKQPEETTASKYDVDTRYAVLKELEAALTQEQDEPVGQLLENAFGRGQVMWFNKPEDESMLYTHPQPKQEQGEPLPSWEQIYKDAFEQGVHEGSDKAMNQCRLEYLKQVIVRSAPQQRKPLTDVLLHLFQEWKEDHLSQSNYIDAVEQIKAAHGIKETK